MGCFFSKKNNEPFYDPVYPYKDEDDKLSTISLSKYLNIWIDFNDNKPNRIFYRRYSGKIPENFYNL